VGSGTLLLLIKLPIITSTTAMSCSSHRCCSRSINVGFNSREGLSEFSVVDSHGNIQRGHSNLGHDYSTDNLSLDDKEYLIEYLKTL
jgi:hypothetical protein